MKSENNWIIMLSSLTEATAPLHGQNSQKAPFHPTLLCFQLTKNTSVKSCFCFKTFISPIVLSCCFIKMLYSESRARHKRSTCGDDVFLYLFFTPLKAGIFCRSKDPSSEAEYLVTKKWDKTSTSYLGLR